MIETLNTRSEQSRHLVCSLTRKKQVMVKCIKTTYTDGSRNPHFDDDEREETFVKQKGLVTGLKPSKSSLGPFIFNKTQTSRINGAFRLK